MLWYLVLCLPQRTCLSLVILCQEIYFVWDEGRHSSFLSGFILYPFNVILLNTFRFQGTCSWIVHLYLLYQSLMLLWVYINIYVGKCKILNFYFGEHILLLQKICIWLPGTLSVAHNSVRSRGSPEWVKSWVDMFIVNMNQPSQVP